MANHSTRKKVILRKMDQEQIRGWVELQSFLGPNGVEMLKVDGLVTMVPFDQLKALHFVREFEDDGDQLERKVFASRPKLEGLWLRLRFKDSEVIEGILPNNLLLVEGAGFTITPPDPYANSQKIFVPREALTDLTVLGVIGSAAAPSKRKKTPAIPEQQIRLFQ